MGGRFCLFSWACFWFPKVFGYKPNRALGIASFWCWFIGFHLAFFPVYALGLMGATRRLQHYMEPSWQPMFMIAALGAFIILLGILCFVLQVVLAIWYGIKHKGRLPVTLNDSWVTHVRLSGLPLHHLLLIILQ